MLISVKVIICQRYLMMLIMLMYSIIHHRTNKNVRKKRSTSDPTGRVVKKIRTDLNGDLFCRFFIFLKLISSLRPSSTNANLLQRVPPFVFHLFYVTYKTGRLQRVPLFNFFRHCANFFRKFFMSQKSPPFGFFDILQQKVC